MSSPSSTSTRASPTSSWRRCSTSTGLGLTRDPYLMTSVTNMWVNVGRSQFHLPTGKAAGPARPHRPRHPQPRCAGAPARRGEEAARGHPLRLHRAQRLRRGDLPLGQPHPLLRARRALRPHACSACPMSSWRCRAARSTASPASTARCSSTQGRRGRGRARAACVRRGRPRPASRSSARRTPPRRPSTATTSPSISPTSPAPIAACWSGA